MKKIFMFFIALTLFYMPNIVNATSENSDAFRDAEDKTYYETESTDIYKRYDYLITNYDVDIKVNENNTFDITETIDVDFLVDKHGIFRRLPLKNEIERLDGTISRNYVKISNIEVSDEFEVSKENGNKIIKIGSIAEYLKGPKKYKISYTYDIGVDPLDEADELYFNIIGNEWDTQISKVDFKITMPKDFDESYLGFSSGSRGSTDSSDIYYTVNDNVITGTLNKTLNHGQGLTVRLELPEGYFVGARDTFGTLRRYAVIVPIIFLIISLLLWSTYGKDEPVVETVEFYPPKGLNSLEVAQIYNYYIRNNDITSLLIYLASKGYIKIEETDTKGKGFKFTKLKDYDGDNEVEASFLSGLFLYSYNEVTLKDLERKFYRTMNDIDLTMNRKNIKGKIFEVSSYTKKAYIYIMCMIILTLITVPPTVLYKFGEITPGILLGVLFPSVAMFFVNVSKGWTFKIFNMVVNPIICRIISLIVLVGSMIMLPLGIGVIPSLLVNITYLYIFIIGTIIILILLFISEIMPKRTPYGNELYGRLKGFRTFLVVAEKARLEALVKENPSYFYDILPYTYVLGVSNTWIRKFESISIESPSWYAGTTAFSVASFGSTISSTMNSASTVMSSTPRSSGSSSHSGGGFSGGGSGGGGGGSW